MLVLTTLGPCLAWLGVVGILGVQPVLTKSTREDGRCGPGNLAPDGKEAKCEHIPPFPTCCQKNGHCGWDCDDVRTVSAEPGRPAAVAVARPIAAAAPAQTPVVQFTSNGKYRSDGHCGPGYSTEDGSMAECDPNSEYWCCSEHGFCGSSQEHCYCDTCVNYRPIDVVDRVRSDRRCGSEFPLDDGAPSECNGASENPCCSKFGYCGPGPAHCSCPGCVDYRGDLAKVVSLVVGKVRTDRRCGAGFPLDDGEPSECDGSSDKPCCSKWGYCGPGDDYCGCDECVDYRTDADKAKDWVGTGKWRLDRRCGPDFPLLDESGPTECNPDDPERFCCSKWGFCGGDEEHCDCDECVNYAKK